jgi:hypothetical protein
MGMIETMSSSSRPASANWAASSPPPTTQTFFPAASLVKSSANSLTAPRTNVTSAPGGAVNSWWVKTQQGVPEYGQFPGSWSMSHW